MAETTPPDTLASPFEDDSSSSIGLNHAASSASLPSGGRRNSGGIEAFFAGDTELIEKNRREDFERRVSQLMREQGKTIKQAEQQAWQEQQDPEIKREIVDRAGNKLRQIENLMGVERTVHSGGGGGNRSALGIIVVCSKCGKHYDRKESMGDGKRRRADWLQRCSCDPPDPKRVHGNRQLMGAKSSGSGSSNGRVRRDRKSNAGDSPYILASYAGEKQKETEEQRAQRLHDQNVRAMDRKRGSGKPLKGKEPRMVVSIRLEPLTVMENHSITGRGSAELIEEMNRLLKMAKTGAEASAILAELESIMVLNASNN